MIPASYLAAMADVLNPPRPRRRFTDHNQKQYDKTQLKEKRSKRKEAKASRKRNRK